MKLTCSEKCYITSMQYSLAFWLFHNIPRHCNGYPTHYCLVWRHFRKIWLIWGQSIPCQKQTQALFASRPVNISRCLISDSCFQPSLHNRRCKFEGILEAVAQFNTIIIYHSSRQVKQAGKLLGAAGTNIYTIWLAYYLASFKAYQHIFSL